MPSYHAFISYSHDKDKPIAAALQSVVQTLGKPWYRRRALRVFRDDTSLTATPHLWPSITQALDQSEYFILLASPEAARSRWVDQEVSHWLAHRSIDTLLIGLTDGQLAWDERIGGFRPGSDLPLPPVLRNRFPNEPKWVDLRAYRGGANPRDTRFIELGADFAAMIRGIPKEDLLSEEVRQQRRALRLAWGAAALLLALAGAAGWQWKTAADAERAALRAEQIATERGEEALRERDRAQQALLVGAGRESLLLTREGRSLEGWQALMRAIGDIKDRRLDRPPKIVAEAGLTALVENRFSPELRLALSDRSIPGTSDLNYMGDPLVVAAFDASGRRVAAARGHDLAIWSTADGALQSRYVIEGKIRALAFHEKDDILIVLENGVTVIDLAGRVRRTFNSRECRGISCLAAPGQENGAFADIRRHDRLAEVVRTGTLPLALLVTLDEPEGRHFVGIVQNRFAIFNREPELIVADLMTRQIGRVKLPGEFTYVAVAARQPVIATGQLMDVALYRIEVDPKVGTRVALRPIKRLKADDALSELALSDDATLVLYSTGPMGSSGQGGHTTGAIDVQSGRLSWLARFLGQTKRGPGQAFAARSTLDDRTGLMFTQFVNGRTSENLFAVPGMAVAFDPAGRMALMEMDPRLRGSDSTPRMRGPFISLHLVELSTVTSFANDGRAPQGERDVCDLGPMPFRTLTDRNDRLWNSNDWRRTRRGGPGIALERDSSRVSRFDFRWKGDRLTLSRDSDGKDSVLGTGTRDEIAKMVPEYAELIEPGQDMRITEVASADRRFTGIIKWLFKEGWTGEWTLFRNDPAKQVPIRRGRVKEDGLAPMPQGLFFLDRLSMAAAQEDSCSIVFVRLTDGEIVGKVRAAKTTIENVVQIANDLIAVISSGTRDTKSSLQIFDMPDFNPGPWLVSGDDEGYGEDMPKPVAGSGPRTTPLISGKDLLEASGDDSHPADDIRRITDEGRYVVYGRSDRKEGFALSIPPWGKRLRDLMTPR